MVDTARASLNSKQLAQNWVDRKIRGQRVIRSAEAIYGKPTLQQMQVFNEANQIYLNLIRDPRTQSAIQTATAIKTRAKELGFKSIREYQALSNFAKKKLATSPELLQKRKQQQSFILQEKRRFNETLLKATNNEQRRRALNAFKANVKSIRAGYWEQTKEQNPLLKAINNARLKFEQSQKGKPKDESVIARTARRLGEERTKVLTSKKASDSRLKKIKTISDAFGLTIGKSFLDTVYAGEFITKGLYSLRKKSNRDLLVKTMKEFTAREKRKAMKLKDEKVRRQVLAGLDKQFKQGVQFAKKNPEVVVAFVGGELIQLYVGSKTATGATQLAKTATRNVRRVVNISLPNIIRASGSIVKVGKIPKFIPDKKPSRKLQLDLINRVDGYVTKKLDNFVKRLDGVALEKLTEKRLLALRNRFTSEFLPELKLLGIQDDLLKTLTKKQTINRNILNRIRVSLRKSKRKSRVRKAERVLKKEKKVKEREYQQALKSARKRREKSRKTNSKFTASNTAYKEAIVIVTRLTDDVARVKALEYLIRARKLGIQFTKEQGDNFVRQYRKSASEILKQRPEFKKLVELSGVGRSDALRIIKVNRKFTAKSLYNALVKKINEVFRFLKIDKGLKIVKKRVKGVTRKVTKPIKKEVKRLKAKKKRIDEKARMRTRRKEGVKRRKKLARVQRREYKKSNKYKMDQQRRVRVVTVEQLESRQFTANVQKLVDEFFKFLQKNNQIRLSPQKLSQLKTLIKKYARKASQKKDRKSLERLRDIMAKTLKDAKKKKPNVVVEIPEPKRVDLKTPKTAKPKKSFKTLRDFEVDTPKGVYQEVKVGDKVLLQRVDTIQDTVKGTIKKQKSVQKVKVKKVQKKAVNIAPVVGWVGATVLSFARVKGKSAVGTSLRFSPDVKSDTKQVSDLLSSQSIAQARSFNQAVSSGATKIKTPLKTKTVQEKKKKVLIPKLKTPKAKKALGKGQQAYFVVVKERGKIKKLLPSALTLNDAKDYLTYRTDNRLGRTAFYVSAGKQKDVLKLPKVVKGYYNRNKRKFRPYKIRAGKKKTLFQGFIEKSKYTIDTKGEKAQLKRARRPMTATTKKKLLANLKKARLAKKRKSKK